MTLFQRVMRLRKAVVFHREAGYYGLCWTKSRRPILINLSLHARRLPERTYWHECIHLLYPEMSERDVRGLEEMTWQALTAKQRFLLARKLYHRKWRVR